MKKINSKILIPLILLVLLCFVPQVNISQYLLQVIILMLLYAGLSSCWNLIGGYAGQFALGNGVYIGIGGYFTAILFQDYGVNPWIGMWVGVIVSMIIAYLIGRLCFRLSGTYFALSTVAFLHMFRFLIIAKDSLFGIKHNGGIGYIIRWVGGLQFIQVGKKGWFYIYLIFLVIVVCISAWVKSHKIGYYLTAIKTNQGAAGTIGVNVIKYKLIVQCLSAGLLAIGGAFYCFFMNSCNPLQVFGYAMSLQLMMYSVVGGLGTVWGPVVGACILTGLNEFVRVKVGANLAPLALVFYGLILIVIVRFAPRGIVGMVDGIINKIKGKNSREKEVAAENE